MSNREIQETLGKFTNTKENLIKLKKKTLKSKTLKKNILKRKTLKTKIF